jgi:hypothetical protein
VLRPNLLIGLILSAAPAAAQQPVFLLDHDASFDADGADTRAVVPADFNGDGRMDLFVANVGTPNDLYVSKKHTLALHAPTVVSNGDTPSMDGAWGDMDGDGDPDLAVANGSDSPNQLFWNQGGSSNYTSFVALTGDPAVTVAAPTQALAWGDVDGDGDLDLITANKRERNGLYLNDGSGAFSSATGGSLAATIGPCRDVVLADLDGDGDLEAVFANSNHESNFLHVNQGGPQGGVEGDFALRPAGDPVVDDLHPSFGVSVADVEQDGDLDLFVANRKGEDNVLYLNDGAGAFSAAHGLQPSRDGGDSFAATWADVNDDGLPDLYVANQLQAGFLYLNGPGGLTRAEGGQLLGMVQNSRDAAFVTLGKDSLPDLVVGNSVGEQSLIFENLERYRVATTLLRPASAPDPDAKGQLKLEARPLKGQGKLAVKVEKVNTKLKHSLFVEDPPGSKQFSAAGNLRRKGKSLELKFDTKKGDALPLDLAAMDFVGRQVQIRRSGATVLTGTVGLYDTEDQKRVGQTYLVRSEHALDGQSLAVAHSVSAPDSGVEQLTVTVTTSHPDRAHLVFVEQGGAMLDVGSAHSQDGRLVWSLDLAGGAGGSGLQATSVEQLSGRPLEVHAGGHAVLTGLVPNFADHGASKARKKLQKAPTATTKLWGWLSAYSIASLGDERFGVTVRGKGVDDEDLSLHVETTPGSGALERVAPFVAGSSKSTHVLALRKRGDPLPLGVATVAELAGRRVEVRDGDGVVQLVGTIPTLR